MAASPSSSSFVFKLRDYVTIGIFLLALLQNLSTYWKETKQHTQLLSLEQQHQQYSSSSKEQQKDDSRRIAAAAHIVSNITTSYYDDETTTTIRRWGCNLQQTPLIYIHIGKAGGGMVRARFAASALEFGEVGALNQSWQKVGKAYYPVRVDESDGNNGENYDDVDGEPQQTDGNGGYAYKKGYFCNSRHPNFRSHGKKSYEGTQYCHATTPLGQAVACPVPLLRNNGGANSIINTTTTATGIIITTNNKKVMGACRKSCHFLSDSCRIVYVGHNLLGSEMHWLPQRYLSNWWKNNYLKSNPPISSSYSEHSNVIEEEDKIQAYLQTLAPGDPAWCPYMNKSRPVLATDYVQEYAPCSVTLGQVVDKEAFLTVQARHYHPPTTMSSTTSSSARRQLPQHPLDYIDWSHIYASMPVLRTTIIREPFSWLVSKFFWHSMDDDNVLKCDDVEMATMPVSPFTIDDKVAQQGGWANRYALNYITYLCGEDCAARYHQGIGNLQQMERQAANNLRHSFAVVGLLHETDTFYDMVTKRVQYVNMSLHPDVQGGVHSIGNGPEQLRCKDKFSNTSVQALLKEKSPLIAAIDRLYQVGVQVNRFQLEELQSCPTTTTRA